MELSVFVNLILICSVSSLPFNEYYRPIYRPPNNYNARIGYNQRENYSKTLSAPGKSNAMNHNGIKPTTDKKSENGSVKPSWEHTVVDDIVDKNLERIISFIAGQPNKYKNNGTLTDEELDNLWGVEEKAERENSVGDGSSSRYANASDPLHSLGQSSHSANDAAIPVILKEGTVQQSSEQQEQLPFMQRFTLLDMLEALVSYIADAFVTYTRNYFARVMYRSPAPAQITDLQNLRSQDDSSILKAQTKTVGERTPGYSVKYIQFRQPSLMELFQGFSAVLSTLYLSVLPNY